MENLTLESLEALVETLIDAERAEREKQLRMIAACARIVALKDPEVFTRRACWHGDEEGHWDNSYPPKQTYSDRRGPSTIKIVDSTQEDIATSGGYYYSWRRITAVKARVLRRWEEGAEEPDKDEQASIESLLARLNQVRELAAPDQRTARMAAGLSQEEYAREIGVHRVTVSTWEREESARVAQAMEEVLGSPVKIPKSQAQLRQLKQDPDAPEALPPGSRGGRRPGAGRPPTGGNPKIQQVVDPDVWEHWRSQARPREYLERLIRDDMQRKD